MRVVAYQGAPVTASSISEAFEAVGRVLASAPDADIVCFPECYLSGYSRELPEALTRSINLQSDEFERGVAALGEYPPTVILGVIEREAGNLFNTAVVFGNGRVHGKYRKQHPNEPAFTAGNQSPVFGKAGVTFGVNICNDANYPESAQKLSDLGARIIFYPLNNSLPRATADKWRSKHLENLVTRAEECGVWVVSSDVVEQGVGKVGYGCTAIINPAGVVVQQCPELRVGLVSADITI